MQVLLVWTLWAVKVSAKDRFPLCPGDVSDRFLGIRKKERKKERKNVSRSFNIICVLCHFPGMKLKIMKREISRFMIFSCYIVFTLLYY